MATVHPHPAIRFEDVTKRFTITHDRPRSLQEAFVGTFRRGRGLERETLTALDAVSFEIAHGESLGLVGPNGTGKSTTLKLVARILEPSAGRVVVDGRVAALLELGAGFHPDLTGRENVFLNGSLLGLSRARMNDRFERIVDFSELQDFIDMPVKHYSSGMYMRLGFATAIHLDAEILLVDEILAVGDQNFQSKCRERIAALRKAGVTILFVSHSPEAVRELCDRAIWLERGKVLADGPTDAVVEAYYASMVERESRRLAAEAVERGGDAPASPVVGPRGGVALDRYGSGEVEILGVDILDDSGARLALARTGDPLVLQLRYLAHERIERPVFGIALHRDDGVHITGPNTRDMGLDIDAVEGPGVIRIRLPRLALMEGSYELSVACYDHSLSHPYDHHHRRFPLRVRAGDVRERLGLVSLEADWTHAVGEAAVPVSAGDPAAGGASDPEEAPRPEGD
jgi:lipopolysaccharide transport system ATP-binding protein